jgi:hypothetical protein
MAVACLYPCLFLCLCPCPCRVLLGTLCFASSLPLLPLLLPPCAWRAWLAAARLLHLQQQHLPHLLLLLLVMLCCGSSSCCCWLPYRVLLSASSAAAAGHQRSVHWCHLQQAQHTTWQRTAHEA